MANEAWTAVALDKGIQRVVKGDRDSGMGRQQ